MEMTLDFSVLTGAEWLALKLRSLYAENGYTRFRMMKFEEYDLYSRNKDFLRSENIITFTDTTGKLMALKPDVTLSIVKSTRDGDDARLYYNESVYRVSSGTGAFREINQVGLECIGHPSCDEVARLAARSLELCGDRYVLQLSHMGIINKVTGGDRRLISCIGEKKLHELGDNSGDAAELILASGEPEAVLTRLLPLCERYNAVEELNELKSAAEAARNAVIDFSDVSDTGYYNGLLFKGYLPDIPGFVLSGGSYDGLMAKMGREDRAIGFAVYLDMLERLGEEEIPC